MSEVTDRLERALELGGIPSIRALWTKLQDEGLYSTTYSTVHRYFTGGVEPPLEFLRATAKATGVREPWLVLGYGTDQREHSEFAEVLAWRIQRGFPGWERLASSTRALLVATVQNALAAASPGGSMEDWIDRLVEGLAAPIWRLGIEDIDFDVGAGRMDAYVLNICAAVQALTPRGAVPGGSFIRNVHPSNIRED